MVARVSRTPASSLTNWTFAEPTSTGWYAGFCERVGMKYCAISGARIGAAAPDTLGAAAGWVDFRGSISRLISGLAIGPRKYESVHRVSIKTGP